MAEPTRHLRITRDRLDRIRAGDNGSEVDDAMVEAARTWEEPVQVVLFRARRTDPDRSWGFAEDLSEAEADAIGYEMVRAQLSLYRRLVANGIFALVGTEMGPREVDLFARGTERLSRELEQVRASGGPRGNVAALNLWLLDHLALWTSHPLDEFVRDKLPRILGMLERRGAELQELQARIDAG